MSDYEYAANAHLGTAGYTAYREETGGVSLVSGDQLPRWADLPLPIKKAWVAAAMAIRKELTDGAISRS